MNKIHHKSFPLHTNASAGLLGPSAQPALYPAAERFLFQPACTAVKGFTLMELLVVLLIIGILAAVAIPKYNRTMEFSRATQAISVVNALDKALDLYLMENDYPASEGTLDLKSMLAASGVQFPAVVNEGYICFKHFRVTFSCQRNRYNTSCTIRADRLNTRISRPSTCNSSGFPAYSVMLIKSPNTSLQSRYCDAYEDFSQTYNLMGKGTPTAICNMLKNNGQINKVVLHN